MLLKVMLGNQLLFEYFSRTLFETTLVGGYDKVYTVCKNFRNEDVDKTHNPEFTMSEFLLVLC